MPQYAHMVNEFSLIEEAAIGVPNILRNVGILDRGHAFLVHDFDAAQNAGAPLRGTGWRNELRDRIHCRFLEYAGGLALRVMINGAGWRIRRAGVDLCQ